MPKRGSAALLPKGGYHSPAETSHLLRTPKNAQRLLSVLESACEGNVVEHGLLEP